VTSASVDHAFDGEAFRDVMAALASGVAVVTTVDAEGTPRGLTTTAVTSVSVEPPLLLVCVGRESRTLPAIRHSRRFAVNIIDSASAPVAHHFASKAPDKFADAVWRPGANGCPLLHEHSVAWAECRTEREVEAGDHVVVIGRVDHGWSTGHERVPLTYLRRNYGAWAALPNGAAQDAASHNGFEHLEKRGVEEWQAQSTR
jgi:flavin reductase (DIM6/NTAB) family NADH-FMN oxidoreductase RutF